MVAPVLGLPALLQAIATIGVGGAIGYKAQKDLQPVIKKLKASPEDMDSSELRMLRALLMPSQAIGSQIKEDITTRSVGTTGEGAVIGPRAEDIEQVQEEIKEVSKPPVTKTPVEPITTETFPDEPQIKQNPPVQPEVDLETKETFPADTAIDPAPVFYEKAIEGGKEIKDVTAGVSAQKDKVPELLEQGKLAMPIKKFFEDDNQVVNYKIGDTIGAYGQTVERSLDIEANVKKDFNLDSFGEVIKQRAKEFDQDAVFVAESVPSDFEGANVGFEMDFGSNLKIQDAINFAGQLSETATLDGFTFKVKNLDTSGSSLYLPQTPKDLELIEKSIKKYGVTDDIRKAGFIMPDGKMLNMTMRGGNLRDTEHRRVAFLNTEGYDGIAFGPMYDWMIKTGGVRVTGNRNRLYAELVGKPTSSQIQTIVDEYNQNRDQYDSMIIGVTMPGDEDFIRQGFGTDEYLPKSFGDNLRNSELRLGAESFYEVNGEDANAGDILRKLKGTDIIGKTFTGIRQLNIPEFSNISNEDALKKIMSIEQNLEGISENAGLKMLDKPKVKFYNTKLYTKGKDY